MQPIQSSNIHFCHINSSHTYKNKNISLVAPRDIIIDTGDPCIPSPCGPNSQCRIVGNTPACSCLPDFIGRAPNCRPECMISAECPSNLACINIKCSDPCIGACGVHTKCTVLNHNSVCQCLPGYTGDPFSSCTEVLRCKTFDFFITLYILLYYSFILL